MLAQARSPQPRVCFVGTASGDSDAYLARFYAAFSELPCRPRHLPLFRRTRLDLRDHLAAQDVVYVGGGNTRSMLSVWREWGVDDALRRAWETGVVLAGVSAGAICWFEQGITDSADGPLQVVPCLGLLAGSCCPHYDGEPERRPAVRRLLAGGALAPGLAIDDGAAVHFAGSELRRVVAARPEARAHRVTLDGGEVRERTLEAEALEPGAG